MTTVRTKVLRSPKTGDIATSGSVQFRAPYDQTAPDGTTIYKGLVTDPIALVGGKLPDTDIPPGDYEVKIKVENVTRRLPSGESWLPITVGSTAVDVIDAIAAFTQWSAPVVSAAQTAAAQAAASAAAAQDAAAAAGQTENLALSLADITAGTFPSTAQTGQTVTFAPAPATTGQPNTGLINGRGAFWATPGGANGSGVAYAAVDMGATPKWGRLKFAFLTTGSGTAGTACIAVTSARMATPMPSGLTMGVHFWSTRTAWAMTVWQNGAQQIISQGTYVNPLMGSSDYPVEYSLAFQILGNTILFRTPDGVMHKATDSRFASLGGPFMFGESLSPNSGDDVVMVMSLEGGDRKVPGDLFTGSAGAITQETAIQLSLRPTKTVTDATYAPMADIVGFTTGTGTRKLAAAMQRALDGTGTCSIAIAGDSMTTAYTGAGFDFPNAWYRRLKADLVAAGYVDGGTGWVGAMQGDAAAIDPRWVVGSGWALDQYAYLLSSTGGAVATFTSDVAGTAVSVTYGNTAAPFTVAIDGGTPVTVTPDGNGTVKAYTVTGLANTTHVVRIVGQQSAVIIGASVTAATGLTLSAVGKYGLTAVGLANDYSAMKTTALVAVPAPDALIIPLGANDLTAQGRTVPQVIADFRTIRAMYPNADVILAVEPQTPAMTTSASWTDFQAAIRALGVEWGAPVVDLHRRWGGPTSAAALGFVGADNKHPNAAGQRDVEAAYLTGLRQVFAASKSLSKAAADSFYATSTQGAKADAAAPQSALATPNMASLAAFNDRTVIL